MGAQTFPRIWRVSVSAGNGARREDFEGKEGGMKGTESEVGRRGRGGEGLEGIVWTANEEYRHVPAILHPPQLGSSPSSLWIPAYNCPVNYNKMEGKARNNLSRKLIKTYRPELRTFSNGRSFVIISLPPLSLSWERRGEIKSWYLLNRRNGLKKKKRKEGEKDSKTFSLFLFPLSS